ncbi:MAG: hypothetical protein AAB612_02135 [Patescibacteria group bacterium]
MEKLCARCKKLLDESKFNWKFKNIRRATYCKECSREYIKEHYEKNKPYYLKKAKKRNVRLRKTEHAYVLRFLRSHPCVDCGETDIVVLEFDHRNQFDKDYEVSQMIQRRMPANKIIDEISKCDVRCANCHRRKTVKETKSWRLHLAPVA